MDASYIPIAEAGGFTTHWIILRYFFYLRINGHKACFRMSRINILIPVSTQHDSHESIRYYDTASSGWKKRKKCYWLRKYAKILKDIYQKTDEKYNSAPASHHHTQLIFLSQRSVKDCKNQNRKNTAQKYSCNYSIYRWQIGQNVIRVKCWQDSRYIWFAFPDQLILSPKSVSYTHLTLPTTERV